MRSARAGTGGFGINLTSVAYTEPLSQYVLGGRRACSCRCELQPVLRLDVSSIPTCFQAKKKLRWYSWLRRCRRASILINTRHLYTSFSTQLREYSLPRLGPSLQQQDTTNCNYDKWPLFPSLSYSFLMFHRRHGGGSTAAGLKVESALLFYHQIVHHYLFGKI